MVQLVPQNDFTIEQTNPKFQFHYGSISSISGTHQINNTSEFQFHYGSISSLLIFSKYIIGIFISIPLWFN